MNRNKNLIAGLPLLLASFTASAQTGVTLYGIADMGVTYASGSLGHKLLVGSGQLSASRLGFKGVEDLGGGLSASFNLEAGLNLDSGVGVSTSTNNQASGVTSGGGLTFNRVSYLGLASKTWGELRLGRDYAPTFNGHVNYDPAFLTGAGTSQTGTGSLTVFAAPNGARSSNGISYYTPQIGRFSAQAMVGLGENAQDGSASEKDGYYHGARVNYVDGPLDLSLAGGHYQRAAVADMDEWVLGAAYVLGPVKLLGIYLRNDTGNSTDVTAAMLGATYSVGVTTFKTSLSRSTAKAANGAPAGSTTKLMLGATYALSKRTQLYVTGAATHNSDGAAAVPSSQGGAVTGPNRGARALDLGVRHIF
ncbi:MAG: porin [Pseudomonadota bacterium]